MPTKAMIRSAEVMHLVARRAAEFGVEIEGTVRFNLAQAVARKNRIVRHIIDGIYRNLERRREAITFLRGQARFVSDHEVDTGEKRLSFEKCIIATGARRVIPPIEGLENVEVLNNNTALHLERLPSSLIVIGGGYVGIEFAQMYARFGTRVTLLGRNPQLAKTEDRELAALLADYLREEGIDVHTAATVVRVSEERGEKVVVARIGGEKRTFRGEAVLLAAGRVGNTDALHPEAAGVEVDRKGFVKVDAELRTSQPHIWAIGDVKGGWMFTHVASYDGPIAALNAVKGLGRQVDYRVVPRAIFSDPTLAAVGLTEDEARARLRGQGRVGARGGRTGHGHRRHARAVEGRRGREDQRNSGVSHTRPSRRYPPPRGRCRDVRPRHR